MSLSPDTEAILLLCGHFDSRGGDLKPLSASQYHALAGWLKVQERYPHSLLDPLDDLYGLDESGLDREHVLRLLERGPALALSVERWLNQGLWISSCADPSYPARYRERLANLAPPILYGAGEIDLLNNPRLAIVGSRNVDADGECFTSVIAGKAAHDNVAIVSGGAKGVDITAMDASIQAGGTVAGVLADSLTRATVKSNFRDAIRNQQLVLLSPYSPSAGFSAGNAMGRNKLIYALVDWALVVDSSVERGGTWSGATENLKHGWAPLFVRTRTQTPPGNQGLISEGGIALDESVIASDATLSELLVGLAQQARQSIANPVPDGLPVDPSDAIFDAVWPHIARHLDTPRNMKELQAKLGSLVSPRQLQIWIARAQQDGLVERKTRPVRYRLKQPDSSGPIQQMLEL